MKSVKYLHRQLNRTGGDVRVGGGMPDKVDPRAKIFLSLKGEAVFRKQSNSNCLDYT